MFEKIKDGLARMIFNYPPPIRLITPTLIDRIHESGWSDTSVDDWFYKEDVLKAVELLKRSSFPITNLRIDEIFGDLTKEYDDIHPEDE
jgi:hypothetical protein